MKSVNEVKYSGVNNGWEYLSKHGKIRQRKSCIECLIETYKRLRIYTCMDLWATDSKKTKS